MIIAFSGKKQSGKDTAGNIAQIILNSPHLSNEGVKTFLRKQVNPDNFYYKDNWIIKKFADKLKDIVCLLIGCTREQLEDEDFKNKELLEEWWCYNCGGVLYTLDKWTGIDKEIADSRFLVKTTPRLLLQLLGTECGRNIIHPNIWVNSLFSDYNNGEIVTTDTHHILKPVNNWIITDMRFPNEISAVKDRDGICIRINRPKSPERLKFELEEGSFKEHESETALDDYDDWDYIIDNNGTIDDLINQVRRILQAEFIEKQFYNERSN